LKSVSIQRFFILKGRISIQYHSPTFTCDNFKGIVNFTIRSKHHTEKRNTELRRYDMEKPLKGVKVVDLTYFVAGPGTGKILSDWGAEVIKVEPSFGDPGRKLGLNMNAPAIDREKNPVYSTYNSNKKGLSMDLKTPEGIEIMDKLLAKSNIFLSSYRTGALKRLGLDYESLRIKHPHLIWGQVNGFGDAGPAKDNPGFDTIAFWARSGAMIDLTERDTAPIIPILAFGDASASCSLAGGLAAALYKQAKTGKGTKVMVSLLAQAIWALSAGVASTQYNDSYPKSRKEATSPVINSYKCKDGGWIFLSILEHERYYPILVDQVFGRKDLLIDKYMTTVSAREHSGEIIAILEKEFAKYTQNEVVQMLTKADIAHDKIRHVKEVASDPQAIENNYIYKMTNRDGSQSTIGLSPVKFDNTEIDWCWDAPLIGQHTDEILKDLGYTDQDIKEYLERNIIVNTKA
jgi:crotonobetainyl-CoA:carnitine CoA-transferase CaiB-like acyl-CoA transferase